MECVRNVLGMCKICVCDAEEYAWNVLVVCGKCIWNVRTVKAM